MNTGKDVLLNVVSSGGGIVGLKVSLCGIENVQKVVLWEIRNSVSHR